MQGNRKRCGRISREKLSLQVPVVIKWGIAFFAWVLRTAKHHSVDCKGSGTAKWWYVSYIFDGQLMSWSYFNLNLTSDFSDQSCSNTTSIMTHPEPCFSTVVSGIE